MERILVIDDDKIIRSKLTDILINAGCIVDTADDGVQGVKAFSDALKEGKPYQLIFCDIIMPNLDGQATILAIRELEKKAGIQGKDETTIIMISSMDDPKYIVTTMYDGGAQNYITKPFEDGEVVTEVIRVRNLHEKKLLSGKGIKLN